MQQKLVNRSVLVLVLIGISLLFLALIKPFLVSIFLASLFAAVSYPVYERMLGFTGQRESLASLVTLLLMFCFVFIPLGVVAVTVFSQALDIASVARPWVQQQLSEPGMVTEKLQALPFYDQLVPYRDFFFKQLGEFVGGLSKVTVDLVQVATLNTFQALLMGFIVLYAMFFFYIDGDKLLYYILYYLPLSDDEEKQLLHRFGSVTKATLKGTAVIGLMQGGLNGVAFAIAGIPSALFWAVTMVFLSVVPGIGTALIWIPAVIYLVVSGSWVAAIILAGFCALVVGSLDNVLRPKLVGGDTQLHELLIFFSTLGGLLMFGFWGFVIGPIIAALFVTVWDLYGEEFSDWLPTTAFIPKSGPLLPKTKRTAQDVQVNVAENRADINVGSTSVNSTNASNTDNGDNT